jgi:DNA-binding PadR family transcriptional regulator
MSPQVFQILLSLVERPLHGYAIIQDVAARTGGEIKLTASTLYDALARLVDQDWIGEVDAPVESDEARERGQGSPPSRSDSRRRYYALTRLGREAAEREAARLQRIVGTARAKNLIVP